MLKQMQETEELKQLLPQEKNQNLLHVDGLEEQNLQKDVQIEIYHQQLQHILKRHLSYERSYDYEPNNSFITGKYTKLKRPQMGQFKITPVWPFTFRLRNIMLRAYNRQELRYCQFQQVQLYFRLDQKQIKHMNCNDPICLQILRFAISNKQQIPSSLVKVIVQMAKTNMTKDRVYEYYLIYKIYMKNINPQQFEPPLDMYVQFIDTGLIWPTEQELNEVFTRNQFLYKNLSNNRQFYPTMSQKMRLIYNQFPYLLDIYGKISNKDPLNFNFGGLKLYLTNIIEFLAFPHEDHLLQRYLPEVKCKYLKLKSNLTISEVQFLFVSLKNIQDITLEEFKLLYHTRPGAVPFPKKHQVSFWMQFWQIEKLCSKILTEKDFHISMKELQQLGELLDYEKCLSQDIIKINLIFFILRQQTYNHVMFSKDLVKNILWIFKNIPEMKKKKQCCYMLLLQYFSVVELNVEKRIEIIKQYNFPEQQINKILDEGRQRALDILLNEQDKNFIFNLFKSNTYMKIIKKVINKAENKAIRSKAVELYKKLSYLNKQEHQDLSFCEENIPSNHELVELLEIQAKKGNQLTTNCIQNIMKILVEDDAPQTRRTCLSTLRFMIKNQRKRQNFPPKFQKNLILLICKLYYQDSSEDSKNQIMKLAVECTYLPDTYQMVGVLIKFFLEIFLKTPVNSFQNINSSFGVYCISLNFKKLGQKYYQASKEFLDSFAFQMLKSYKQIFSSTSKGSINILCAIAALAKNEVLLPAELAEQLTLIARKSKNFTHLALIAALFYLKKSKQKSLSEKSLLDICNILKHNKNKPIIGVYILQNCFQKAQTLPNSVKNKLSELTKTKKCWNNSCERLCKFYRNQICCI